MFRLASGSLFAACGRADVIERYLDWVCGFTAEAPPPAERKDFTGLLLNHSGTGLQCLSRVTFKPVGEPLAIMAIGPHDEFLLGAMYAGASAEEAIQLAIKHCADAGGEVMSARLEPR